MADTGADLGTKDEESAFERHYRELLPEFLELEEHRIAPVNLDITSLVTTILGVHPRLIALENRIRTETPLIDVTRLLRLDAYAMALRNAQTRYQTVIDPPDHLEALATEGKQLRATLLKDASTLAHRKLIDGRRLQRLRRPVGYKNIASDLLLLSDVLRTSLPRVGSKCAIEHAELLRADEISAKIINAVGSRAHRAKAIAKATDIRARAFSVVVRHYEEARDVVAFLRRKERDVDEIIPSLFAARHRGRKRAKKADATAVALIAPAADAASGADSVLEIGTETAPAPNSDPFLN